MTIASTARISLVSVIFAEPALAHALAEKVPATLDPASEQDAPVTKFISQERWTDADRAAMNKMWADELEKPIE